MALWWNGIRAALKMRSSEEGVGSSPTKATHVRRGSKRWLGRLASKTKPRRFESFCSCYSSLVQWQNGALLRRQLQVRVLRGELWSKPKWPRRKVVNLVEAGSSPVDHPAVLRQVSQGVCNTLVRKGRPGSIPGRGTQ